MNIESQVCSLEQAKKLKDLGVSQKSIFYWHPNFDNPVFGEQWTTVAGKQYKKTQVCNDKNGSYSAFTVAELGVMLCHKIRIGKALYKFRANLEKSGLWHLKFRTLNAGVMTPLCITQGKNEAIARAEMLIKLLEKGFLRVTQVTERLKPE